VIYLTYEKKLKKMSIEGLHLECVTFNDVITSNSNNGKLSTPEETDQANSLLIESIKRMENDSNSIELLRTCTATLQNIIKDSSDKYSDIPKQILKWKPK
jgi:predicted ATP-dependent serine protease